jgi:hypothetical protein
MPDVGEPSTGENACKSNDPEVIMHVLTIRPATPADAETVDQLAQLDSTRAPRGQVLLAEVAGDVWAAVSLDDQHVVADPFRPSDGVAALLVERAGQLRRLARRSSRRSRSSGVRATAWNTM